MSQTSVSGFSLLRLSFVFLVCISLLGACAYHRTLNPSDYLTELSYPQQTEQLVFLEQSNSENPLFGTRLTYQSKYFELDIFSVYIYPIRQLNWQDETSILMDEAIIAYQMLDDMVEENGYLSRSLEEIDEVKFNLNTQQITGIRGQSQVHMHDELYMQNYLYLFIQQDKIIRISANMKFADQLPEPDDYIQGLLAGLTVPEESPYMAELRKSVSVSADQ